MNLSILGKIDGAWQSLGTTTIGDNKASSVVLGNDYIYNDINGMIVECMTVSLTADGSSENITQEITLKKPFTNVILTVACSCESTKYIYSNLNVVAIPSGKDKVKIGLRHLDSNVKLEGSFTVFLTCFGK